MNQWKAAEYFYLTQTPLILAEKRNEWAMDPYAWTQYISLSPIEQRLWENIREANVVLYPQYPIDKFFVDFANPVAMVVIECDGEAFHLDAAKDARRDNRLRELGWTVYRINGKDCCTDFNEKTKQRSYARYFIDSIAEQYGIKRLVSGSPKPLMTGIHSVLDHLLKMNPLESA